MGWFWADAQPAVPKAPHPLPTSAASPPPSCPMHNKTAPPATPPKDSACPYNPSEPTTTSTTLSKLNPLNYMPRNLDNTRSATQKISLDLDREPSTIPRGDGTGTTWEYPSPQQMYNAMLRKGYTDTPAEDVPAMVAVHNFLNEGAWGEILGWEARFGGGLARGWEICRRGEENAIPTAAMMLRREKLEGNAMGIKEPSLIRFLGRPDEPTPKARLVQWAARAWPSRFGQEPPFDRHDWYVRRYAPDGSERDVRYVIDYYSAPPDEETGMPVFHLDVRPAVDGPTAACERLMRWGGDVWWRASGGAVREEKAASA